MEWIANYLVYPVDKEERRQRAILTDNRLVTVDKHETSYESLSAKFEAGEDALEAISLSRTPIKTNITQRKRPITQRELDTYPELQQVRDSAVAWQHIAKTNTGRKAWAAQKAYREDMALLYQLRDSYYPPIGAATTPSQVAHEPEYASEEWIDEKGEVHYTGYSLLSYKLCAILLKYYIKLKTKNWGKFNDMWFMIQDFDIYLWEALKDEPLLLFIVEAKWSNLPNNEIVKEIDKEFGKTCTPEFISNVFCNKIPKLISNKYYEHFLDWWYLEKEKGTYKTCTHCGRTLIAHPQFFNRNSTSRDGFYSQCKQCRSERRKKNG